MLSQWLLSFKLWLGSLGVSEEGQGLVEYALIIVLIAIVVIIALTALGTSIGQIFTDITTTLGAR
jgi:pilus assembly protein Flp/PilA